MSEDGFERNWRRRFRDFASARDDDAGIAGWTATGLDTRLRFFRNAWVSDQATGLWLDAGCGAGTYARFLSEQGRTVVGADYSLPALLKGRPRSPAGIRWVVADVTRLPFSSGVFDGALCFGVMQALSRSDAALRELKRAVRPGGEVWIDALNARCLPHVVERVRRRLSRRPTHLRYDDPYALRRAMESSGFERVRLVWLPILPGRLHHLQFLVEARPIAWLLPRLPLLGAWVSHSFVLQGFRPLMRPGRGLE